MIPKMVEGVTRVCGKSQGYGGLPIRDEAVDLAFDGGVERVNAMHTSWEPTPDELARLNAGAPVTICILGNNPPPLRVDVGEAPPLAVPASDERGR